MQKLTRFYFFPIKQNKCLLYTNSTILKSRLFSALSIQITAKESLPFRLRKTPLEHLIGKMLYPKKMNILLENRTTIQLGYLNNNKIILFGFNKENKPNKIYKQTPMGNWETYPFLGYTLIEKYTQEEYFLKRKFIIASLRKRWIEINKGKSLHGDFTHFNILKNTKDKLFFIDTKALKNSKLYDHFYFYSYYIQCIEKSKTITKEAVLLIKKDLQKIVKKICVFNDKKELFTALNSLRTTNAKGLTTNNKQDMVIAFKDFFIR